MVSCSFLRTVARRVLSQERARVLEPSMKDRYQIETSNHECVRCQREIGCGRSYFSTVTFDDSLFRRSNYCEGCWRQAGLTATADEGANGAPENLFAFWKTSRPEPPQETHRRVRFDPAVVMGFFRRLTASAAGETASTPRPAAAEPDTRGGSSPRDQAGEPVSEASESAAEASPPQSSSSVPAPGFDQQKRDLGFVLALLLVRKKLLNFESSVQREGKEWLKLTERGGASGVHWVENPELTDEELERVRDSLGDLLEMRI